MTVTFSQIHKVLQTYGKQVQKTSRAQAGSPGPSGKSEEAVRFTAEAKRAKVVDRVAAELISRLASSGPNPEGLEKDIIDELSGEYGQPLTLSRDAVNGQLVFHLVDPEEGVVLHPIQGDQAAELTNKVMALAQKYVDKTML